MILKEFECVDCGVFEDLVNSSDKHAVCPNCGLVSDFVMSSPKIGTMHNPDVKKDALLKRSKTHSMKEVSKEYEKFGFKKDVQRKWNVRNK